MKNYQIFIKSANRICKTHISTFETLAQAKDLYDGLVELTSRPNCEITLDEYDDKTNTFSELHIFATRSCTPEEFERIINNLKQN